ncbi:GTPase Era [bioreactor metagenome]|uniref:GTPase Era n=1 Tax=bioreactor metagenome TaxID=1076179 RepID=A0A644Y6H3_9ZZZZ
MNRGNVLVIGNSGVGKSTLINALLGEERAKTGWGTEGTTEELAIYESDTLNFRLIDTVGFEPSWFKGMRAINSVIKWSKNSAKEGHADTQINVIWFCVEGTAGKLFAKSIHDLSRATSMWPSVPVIVVITKSYSVPDRSRNIEMVYNAFAKQKKYTKNLRKVIPVVAQVFVLNDNAFAPPEGLTELIEATNELMPEGMKSSEHDIAAYKLNRKRFMSQAIVSVSTTAAVVVGAVPIPFPDATILMPLEVALVNSLAQVYEIKKDEASKNLFNTIVEVGTVSIVARQAINAAKAIPGLNIGAAALNAIVAGSIVAVLGEGTIYVFEQIYLGNKAVTDLEWVQKIFDTKFTSSLQEIIKTLTDKSSQATDTKTVVKLMGDVLKAMFGK